MRSLRWLLAGLAVAAAGLLFLEPAKLRGQRILQEGFEARGPVWKAGSTDARPKVLVHELTTATAHAGRRSEHIRLDVQKGTFIHYTYDLPRAPINEELNVSLWLKSNRPGVQLLCRIVLPRERDPANLGQPLTTLVRCEPYQSTRWKLIDWHQPVKQLRKQKPLLTARVGREVDTTDAYIDQLVLNLHDGTGVIDVWIDDLEVGPVLDSKPAPRATPVARSQPGPVAAQPALNRRSSEVEVQGNQLKVGGKRFLLRGIRHTGTPLRTLRDAGFNTVWLDETTPAALIEEAGNLGFWIVPSFQQAEQPITPTGGRFSASEAFNSKVSRFLEQESVLAWDLGSSLNSEQFGQASQLARAFRAVDPHRPVLVDVWDGYRGFSRSFEQLMLGTHRWPLFTSLELSAYRDWLNMRRLLAVDNYSWTWVQTHSPEWYTRLVYNTDSDQSLKEPAGPMPEQIRLLAYCAVAAGYRGLAFWSDRYLAEKQGRDRLLALALLNQELRLLEPVLTQAMDPPEIMPTNHGDVQVAVIRTPRAILALPICTGSGSQYCPGQASLAELHVTVPVMNTATAWEISPGRIRAYPVQRVQGGTLVKLRNFSLTGAVLFTSDLSKEGLVVQLQNQQRRMGRLAAQWLCDQAGAELNKVEKVFNVLVEQGHAQPDGAALLRRAREALLTAQRHRRNGEHTSAYSDAEIALKALRVLMRSHWNRATRDLDSPVASPYALSFFTLPQHWDFLAQLKQSRPAPSVLKHGDFELPPDDLQPGWVVQDVPSLDAVKVRTRRVALAPHGGKQCLLIEVKARNPARVPGTLERTWVAVHSPPAPLKPGSLVRVSAWVKTSGPVTASADGAMIWDSVGGEQLAVRVINEPKWKRYSMYRRVPASGAVSVTVAMTGLGAVFFDDLRIEPLLPAGIAGGARGPGGRPAAVRPAVPPVTPGGRPAPIVPPASGPRAARGASDS